MNIMIGFFGIAALIFALLVVVLRQPMRAALALIAHMISLAAIFACLNVHVVALFQVLIYVGAVMVLMIYTIMLLDDQDASYVHVFSRWSVPAIVVAAIVIAALGMLLGTTMPGAPAVAPTGNAPFGYTAFSIAFMSRYWFHFEVATALLAIGIVAAWTVISQRSETRQ
jgi:NADH-quinone oxidoreductase subunit J